MISADSDIRLLRVFRTVVESGGLACAQADLNLSLSTISGYLASLETRLGLTLCHRGRSGFRLTGDGQAVYDEALRVLSSLSQFNDRMSSLKGTPAGEFRIGLTDNTILNRSLPLSKIIGQFCKDAPDVVISIVTKPPNELIKNLISGEIDIAIASFPQAPESLCYDELYAETQLFYCGEGHPLFYRDAASVGLDEIAAHAIVGRSYWSERDLNIFPAVSARATVSDMEAEAHLILSGRFLGYLPEHYARLFESAGRMRSVRPDLLRYRAVFSAAYKSGARMTGASLTIFLKLLTGSQSN